jgi:hypothetical protein
VELTNYFWNLCNLPEGKLAKSADPTAFTRPAINANPATKGQLANPASIADAVASASPDALDDPASSADPIEKK